MRLREEGVQEVITRLKDARVALGLKGLKHTPTRPIDEKYLPCVFVIEGMDEVTQHSGRSNTGAPMRRVLELHIEMAATRETDIYKLYRDVRSVIFEEGVVVAENTFIQEIRTEGPTGYGLPGVIGIKLILAMSYTDAGN